MYCFKKNKIDSQSISRFKRISKLVVGGLIIATQTFSAYPISKAQTLTQQLGNQQKGSSLNWELDAGQPVQLQVTEKFENERGFAVTGFITGFNSSEFLLKSYAGSVFGWVVLEKDQTGFMYSTNPEGTVEVTSVPYSRIYPVCNHDPESQPQPQRSMEEDTTASHYSHLPGPEIHIGPYEDQDLYKLQSLPEAKQVIYLNITDYMHFGETPAYITREEVYEIWQSLASMLSAFEVNVTTDSLIYKAAGVSNSGIINLLDYDGNKGSIAPIDGYGATVPVRLYPKENGYIHGRVAVHETGHLLGLWHDGAKGAKAQEYFDGFDEFRWVPLMGSHYSADENGWGNNALFQFSEGKYANANNQQKDFELIGRYLPSKKDDIPGTLELKIDGTSGEVSPLENRGRIDIGGDQDQFTFTINEDGGSIDVIIDRTEFLAGTLLDVHALLHDSDGKLIAEHNPKAQRWAGITEDLEPGDYILTVAGGAEGTAANGFTNFSSIGYFAIGGTVTGTPVNSLDESKKSGGFSQFRVYSSGTHINIEFTNSSSPLPLRMYSTAGELVYENIKATSPHSLDAPTPGIYLLEAGTGHRVHRQTVYVP